LDKQPLIPRHITRGPILEGVVGAIHLDRQAQRRTVEIQDATPDRMLATELQSIEATVSEGGP